MSLTAGPPLFRTIRLLHFAARRKLIMGQPVRSLSRVIKKMTRSHEKDLSQLYNEFGDHPYYVAQTLSQAQSEDEDEDANSISSFSTNATADDLPGPGRCIDSFFYQPVGRMLERFAMKIKIQTSHQRSYHITLKKSLGSNVAGRGRIGHWVMSFPAFTNVRKALKQLLD